MVLDMMKVFVSAYWHIPQHRRLCLFTHLITCLGPCKYLSAFIILLQVTHNAIPSKSECCSEVEASEASLSDFCASLLQQFPLRTQVKSFEEMLLLAVALPSVLPSTRSEKTKYCKNLDPVSQYFLLLPGVSERTISTLKLQLVILIKKTVTDRPFFTDFQSLQQDVTDSALQDDLFVGLFRQCLAFTETANRHVTDLSNGHARRSLLKTWTSINDGFSIYLLIDSSFFIVINDTFSRLPTSPDGCWFAPAFHFQLFNK
jgi:hypothetical protein